MATRRNARSSSSSLSKWLAVGAILLILSVGGLLAQTADDKLSVTVENAGEQLTSYTTNQTSGAQVFMNGKWHQPRNVETMLIIGIDDFSGNVQSDSYNNMNQADFLALFVHDADSKENAVIHLNRDTMTDITVLGVTGQTAGTRYAQLALAYNYGSGGNDSSRNTAQAVSRLLYGAEVDHYLAITMDSMPIINDWAGGVTVEVQDDFTDVDPALIPGRTVTLRGDQALTYVRTRYQMEDSSNLKRMQRQRQYAREWVKMARERLTDRNAVMDLVMQMNDYHYSDCTVDDLIEFGQMLNDNENITIHEMTGEAVQGEQYIEYYADDERLQQLVLQLFYKPVDE